MGQVLINCCRGVGQRLDSQSGPNLCPGQVHSGTPGRVTRMGLDTATRKMPVEPVGHTVPCITGSLNVGVCTCC